MYFVKFDGPKEHIPGRATVENIVARYNFTSRAVVFSKVSDCAFFFACQLSSDFSAPDSNPRCVYKTLGT